MRRDRRHGSRKIDMRRRDFITLLGAAAAARPFGARAAAGDPVISFLGSGAPIPNSQTVASFRQGLFEAGYVDGVMARQLAARGKRYAAVDVAIEFRWANFQESLLPRLAADLVRRQPAVIVTLGSSSAALAAKAATATIPIVFVSADDPVRSGLVGSLERPGGNVSGVTTLSPDIVQSRLELLLALVPQAGKVGYLSAPSGSPASEDAKSGLAEAGRTRGREIIVLEVRDREFEAAFASLVAKQAGALMVEDAALFAGGRNRTKILELAARHKIPTIYPARGYAVAGGLMSYDSDLAALLHEVGYNYVGLLLDGSRLPADLSVQRPTKFELVINLKTMKALGLTIPPELRSRVTEVIG
jgi:putative tryptophan/tyrosine transport system substrate-binding protein